MATLGSVTFGGHVLAYAIGSNGYLYGSVDGGSLQSAGVQAKQVSVGLDSLGFPEYYTINTQNQVVFGDVGERLGIAAGGGTGIVTNFATAISATRNDTLFFIGPGSMVYEVVGAERGANASVYPLFLGATQISAGLDAYGRAEVFAIDRNGSVWVDDNLQGWVDLTPYGGLGAQAISAAATGNTVYAISNQNSVYVDHGTGGFSSLGGVVLAISAGTDYNGNPDVYAIGGSNTAYVNDGQGWVSLGGYVTELSATSSTVVFARGQDPGSIFVETILSSWRSLGNIGGANPNAINAGNWAGYLAGTSLPTPQLDSVTSVSGSFVVPTGSYYSAWVGIDGKYNSANQRSDTLEQVGIAPGGIYGGPGEHAWWEMFPLGEVSITTMSINPGDIISASVNYYTSGLLAGYFRLSITDESQPNDSFSTLQYPPTSGSDAPQRNSAEWIVESYLTNPVYFADATATINGTTGPINSPYWQSEALNLGAYGSAAVTTTSMLTNSGDAFVVNPVATPNVVVPNLAVAVPTAPAFNGPNLTVPVTRDRGMATIRDKMGHGLHEFFTTRRSRERGWDSSRTKTNALN